MQTCIHTYIQYSTSLTDPHLWKSSQHFQHHRGVAIEPIEGGLWRVTPLIFRVSLETFDLLPFSREITTSTDFRKRYP